MIFPFHKSLNLDIFSLLSAPEKVASINFPNCFKLKFEDIYGFNVSNEGFPFKRVLINQIGLDNMLLKFENVNFGGNESPLIISRSL